MGLLPGSMLCCRYRIDARLKEGGMGAVYRATDMRLAETPCAVKEILDTVLEGQDAEYIKSKFRSEVQALSRLQHSDIPRVRDFFENDGSLYIVMDLIEGESLDDELHRCLKDTRRPLDPELVVVDILQTLEVLEYLHNHQPPILHRDIKPANLLRERRSGRVKLVDFGLACTHQPGRSNTMVGTPGYCPVEQMQGRAEIRSDLFAVGVTLHQLLTGARPRSLQVYPLLQHLPEADPELARIVDRATSFRAEDRYSHAGAFRADLRRWLQLRQAGATSAQVSRYEPVTAPTTRRSTSHLPLVAGSALILVLSGAWLGRMSRPEPLLAASSPSASPTLPATTVDTVVETTRVKPTPPPAVKHARLDRPAAAVRRPDPVPTRPRPAVRRPAPVVQQPRLDEEIGYVQARSRGDRPATVNQAPLQPSQEMEAPAASPGPQPMANADQFLQVNRRGFTWQECEGAWHLRPDNHEPGWCELMARVVYIAAPPPKALLVAEEYVQSQRSQWFQSETGRQLHRDYLGKGTSLLRIDGLHFWQGQAHPLWGGFFLRVRPYQGGSLVCLMDTKMSSGHGVREDKFRDMLGRVTFRP